jgi:hypothetical protein
MATQALRDEIINFQFEDLAANVVDSFKFEGFDATHIFQTLKQRNNVAASFRTDMNTICLIGMIRGTRSDKIGESMSQAGRTAFNVLVNKYQIVPTVPRLNKKNAITIGRIMSVFPHICLQHALNDHIRDFGISSEIALPRACRFPQFAALIPSSNEVLWNQYLVWAKAMDRVIKGDDHDEALVEKFANTTNNNNLFSDAARTTILTTAGLI